MSWTKGWNFRATSAFVTDTGNNTYSIDVAYPETRNGVTFGWIGGIGAGSDRRDRNSGLDEKFAGMNLTAAPVSDTFQIDLPATGDYVIRASFGDANYGQTTDAVFKDSTTTLASVSATSAGGNQYLDATGVNRTSPSDWISNNASLTKTFATTTFNLVLGSASNGGYVTHIDLDQVASGGPSLLPSFLQIGRGFA